MKSIVIYHQGETIPFAVFVAEAVTMDEETGSLTIHCHSDVVIEDYAYYYVYELDSGMIERFKKFNN